MASVKNISLFLVSCFSALLWAGESGNMNSLSSTLSVSANGTLTRNSTVMTPSYSEGMVDSTYLLGPGDFLDIMLEDTYLSVQVYPDGSVAIDECGVVNVGGKKLSEARTEILKIVAKRYNPQYCFVQLAQLKKFRVNVMGAVNVVGQMMVEPQTRLSLLLRLVGGSLTSGNETDVQVIRHGDTIHVNCTKVFDNGDFENDLMLQQGDQIFVPFLNLEDAVTVIFPGYRGAIPYKKDRTVEEYFKMAGGARVHNFGYQSILIRNTDNTSETISVSDKATKTVQPRAEIEFSVKSLVVYVGGAVAGVGRVNYEPSWHALDYIAASGVTPITGSWSQVRVIRGNRETLSVNVTEDAILPGDFIEIPKSNYENFKDFTLFVASLLTVLSSAFIIYVNYK